MRIGKLCFGSDAFQYGIELCLARAGYQAKTVDKYSAKAVDVLLVSMFWFRDIYLFERFKRDAGLFDRSNNKPIIIIGGLQATLTPELCAEQADYVFIGDGEDYLASILDDIRAGREPQCKYLYHKGQKQIPDPAESWPSAFAIQKGVLRNTTRIEIARGCRHKCKFCVLSQLKSYREVPADDIINLMRKLAGEGRKLFSFFAPERTLHSEWNKIQDEIYRLGLVDVGFDVRLENLKKLKGAGATFGLEGISYRLRKNIGKPFTEKFILENIKNFVESRKGVAVARLNIYWIADLPGENTDDWNELRGLFEKMANANWSRRLTLSAVLNPLSPKPFTELADAPIHPFRDYHTKWLDFLRNGGKGWGFRILEPRVWHSWIRILDALVHRGGSQAYEVIKRMPNKLLSAYPTKENSDFMSKKFLNELKVYGITEQQLFEPSVSKSKGRTKNASRKSNNRAMRASAA